ncbi:DUF1753-domain-containing protein [Ascodesmis nigricans]|uniref:DUF1753-domain-containing protein n=1 Tax=Ascodesmis nigricans TaxID=341454 RepID=A0A4S2N487_9PEZI|nr:DUF1753-domain-containing protein [Ascodesmis nigricans]
MSFLPWLRPKNFLGLIELQYATEFIFIILFINKLSGIFGVLAIFTGYSVSALQLSMYLYSLAAFAFLVYLAPRIRSREPLPALSFAYLFLFDSLINALYTASFGVSWFVVLAAKRQSALSGAPKTIHDSAGFTSPAVNVSHVDVIAAPASGGQTAVAVGTPADSTPALGSGVMAPESATSILIICALWVVRMYFLAVVFAHAREVVRDSATPVNGPFEGKNNGEGWQGKAGRMMISIGRGYWEGDGWMSFGTKFRRSTDPGRRRFRGTRLATLAV